MTEYGVDRITGTIGIDDARSDGRRKRENRPRKAPMADSVSISDEAKRRSEEQGRKTEE